MASSNDTSTMTTGSTSIPNDALLGASSWSIQTSGNSFAGAANNPYAGGGGLAYGSLGNTVVGNNQWIIGQENTPGRFAPVVLFTVEQMVDSVITKVRNRVPVTDTAKNASQENPFANSNNPLGDTKAPALDFLKSVYGEDFPLPNSVVGFLTDVYSANGFGSSSSNPFTGATNANASTGSNNPSTGAASGTSMPSIGTLPGTANPGFSGGNPMVPTGNTSAVDGTAPERPSFDIMNVIFGNNMPLFNGEGTGSQSPSETLRIVQDGLLNFTKTLNSAAGNRLFSSGNNTPIKSPSDLLTLFRNDISSFNTTVNAVDELAGGGNPFQDLFNAGGNQAGDPPVDLLYTVLQGLLPFSGTDNVFNTPEGAIPIGYGNQDFGSNNAVIGNANWNYGNTNATVGNANWLWDSTQDNATIGNGNWYLDYSKENKTVGNGNWYWESTEDNKTLGNGNWHFGNNNTTIGNGNWDFGSNNTVIGNGNWVFTSNSIVIGNGNWSVIIDKAVTSAGDFLTKLDTLVLSMGIKDAADNLIDSLTGQFGLAFEPLKGDLTEAGNKTYNDLFFA
ncbi:MAG: hypothetical protein SAK29_10795 [Scytonema sp. PMC 1069.18]|nr:hypothetical protein [Scytonema sp. PMC 1069.18]MEC4880050.1 hypothetical protein [Scytonema sp. PMC 1070.18]